MANNIITVQDIPITVTSTDMDDYICITDMAVAKQGNSRAADIVKNWLRNRLTLKFLGTWEQIYNPDFKVVEFDHFKIWMAYICIKRIRMDRKDKCKRDVC